MQVDSSFTSRGGALRVLFLVRALTVGGAERQLVETARGLARRGHDVSVAVFYREPGPLEERLTGDGIEVLDLRKGGRWDVFGFLRRLRGMISARGIDAIYAYLPSANIVSSVVGLGTGAAVVWSIRSTNAGGRSYDWLGHAVAESERVFALRADAIVVNSEAGMKHHARRILPAQRLHLVRNGIDTTVFGFDATARERWRGRWCVAEAEPVVLLAARHDPVKGIEVILEACRTLPVRLVVCGSWVEPYTSQLRALADAVGVGARVTWLDRQDDMAGLMSAADVVCSASVRSEGSPNVLIEAAATGALLVGTDVGDTSELVGDAKLTARPGDAASLRRALQHALDRMQGRSRYGSAAPPILERYSMETMLARTEQVLRDAVHRRRGEA